MDGADFAIIRELLVGNHISPRPDRITLEGIGKQTGLHPNTVAARIKRLARERLFLPLTVQVTPAIGMSHASVFYPLAPSQLTDARRATVFEKFPCVNVMAEYVDGCLLLFYAPSPEIVDRAAEEAAKILGATAWEFETSSWGTWDVIHPIPLKKQDPEIISALARDARASTAALAKKLGVTRRTVEKRLQELRDAQAITMMVGGTSVPESFAMGHYVIDLPAEPARSRALAALNQLFPNYFLRRLMKARAYYVTYAPSAAAILKQTQATSHIEGVNRVRARLLTKWTLNPAFSDYLRRSLALLVAKQKDTAMLTPH